MGKVIIQADGVYKSFASEGEQIHVLSDINLKLYEHDYTIVMGVSGSGKSTLLYCLSGMDIVTSGKVTYQEQVISDYDEKQLVGLRRGDFGFVFQQIHLVDHLTLLENIAIPGYMNKTVKNSEIRKRAEYLIRTFELEKIENRLPQQTSGGEQQRAAIARALINEPKILFADEPTGSLNRRSGMEILDIFTKINQQGQSILMVTHDLKAAVRANRILYLSDGRILDEMYLAPYQKKEEKSREIQINTWLSSLSW